MIEIPVLQGTGEWFRARMGVPTASEFHRILTPKKLTLSSQAGDYRHKLLAEYLLQTPFEIETHVWAMDVGIEREQEAADYYELTTEIETRPAGFCVTDDRQAGASPDRFAGAEGLLEIKCPLAPTHIGYLLAEAPPDDYLLQMQGQLFVTQKRWVDWLSYYPGLPSKLLRVFPIPRYQEAIAEALATFCLQLESEKQTLQHLLPAKGGDL